MIVTAVGIGFYSSSNSVFIKPVCEDLEFSRGEYTLHRTIITVLSALLMPVYGRLIRRFTIQKIIFIGAVMTSGSVIAYSFCTEIWHFYAIAIINGLFINSTNFMVVGSLVSNWFHDKKGFATGLAYCGSGLSGAIIVPVLSQIIERFDWRWAYRVLGIVGILLLLPTILFIIRERPEVMGLNPYTTEGKSSGSPIHADVGKGIPFAKAVRTPVFWMLVLALFSISMCIGGPMTHTIPYLSDLGYSTAVSSAVASVYMLLLTLSKVCLGYFYDKAGTLLGGLFLGGCCVLMSFLAISAGYPAAMWAYAVIFGIAGSGFSVPVSIYITKYFGRREFLTLFSICSMVTTLGVALSVPVMGWIYDTFGSYQPAWILFAVLGIFITACLYGVDRLGKKLQTNFV